MNLLHAVILGIVEGITEFLPISSTAHLEITSRLLQIISSEYLKTFEIVIQLGAILAVIILYAPWLRRSADIWKRIIVAFVPTGIVGFLLYKVIKHYLLDNLYVVAWALGIGGIIFLIFELIYKSKDKTPSLPVRVELENMPYAKAFAIGLVQSLSVVPGVSRSAATIIAGRGVGLSKQAVVEFSFLLAIPTMIAASGYDLLKEAGNFSAGQFGSLTVGFVVAFIVALFTVKTFLSFVRNHSMVGFGVYRILLGIALLGILLS